ncbi:MAG: prepilin-type N-terminal cleavage/methylation domain-containing protein [Rhodoferax sp.]
MHVAVARAIEYEPARAGRRQRRMSGFTLIELLVVLAIMALASAGVVFAMRDGASTALEREAQRLAALLESARAQSRMAGVPVRWHSTPTGFSFDGIAGAPLPSNWLSADVRTDGTALLLLGPEPIIGPQRVVLVSVSDPTRSLTLASDGLHPFAVMAQPTPGPP